MRNVSKTCLLRKYNVKFGKTPSVGHDPGPTSIGCEVNAETDLKAVICKEWTRETQDLAEQQQQQQQQQQQEQQQQQL